MRNLKKDEQKIWYALYEGVSPIVDENGDDVGDPRILYSEPIKFKASVSSGASSASTEIFGVNVNFTRTISTTQVDLPITETSLVWIETKPVVFQNGTVDPQSADYMVATRPARGLNQLIIPLKARTKNADI